MTGVLQVDIVSGHPTNTRDSVTELNTLLASCLSAFHLCNKILRINNLRDKRRFRVLDLSSAKAQEEHCFKPLAECQTQWRGARGRASCQKPGAKQEGRSQGIPAAFKVIII